MCQETQAWLLIAAMAAGRISFIGCKAHHTEHQYHLVQWISQRFYTQKLALASGPLHIVSQRTTHYRESALWNGLKVDLKDLSSPGAFRAAVRRCLLARELWLSWLDWLLTTGPALSLALLQRIVRPHHYLLRVTLFFFLLILLLNWWNKPNKHLGHES